MGGIENSIRMEGVAVALIMGPLSLRVSILATLCAPAVMAGILMSFKREQLAPVVHSFVIPVHLLFRGRVLNSQLCFLKLFLRCIFVLLSKG